MNIDKAILMKRFITNSSLFRSVLLTEYQISIINLIEDRKNRSMTSRELAGIKGISIQSASAHLVKLWTKKYLIRYERLDPTGGIFYEYAPLIKFKD